MELVTSCSVTEISFKPSLESVHGNTKYLPVCFADNPGLLSHVTVGIRVLDVNDNPPELAREYDIVVCENSKPGQVSSLPSSSFLMESIHTHTHNGKQAPVFLLFLDIILKIPSCFGSQ